MVLLDKLEVELKIRGYSQKTIKAYLIHNRKFLEFIKKDPEDITTDDIKPYIAHLSDKVSSKSMNLVLSSLAFLYDKILKKGVLSKDEIDHPKTEKKLPTVLTKEEVRKLIAATKSFKHRILVKMLYGSGLRVGECVSIRVNDLDLDEKTGVVRSGKGKKDRNIILSDDLIKDIKEYLKKRKNENPYLFDVVDRHLSVRQAQKVVKSASEKAGLKKRVFCHALRSSFATHLLESGVDIRMIQTLLGHSNLETTQIYTKVSTEQIKKIKSPLDNL